MAQAKLAHSGGTRDNQIGVIISPMAMRQSDDQRFVQLARVSKNNIFHSNILTQLGFPESGLQIVELLKELRFNSARLKKVCLLSLARIHRSTSNTPASALARWPGSSGISGRNKREYA